MAKWHNYDEERPTESGRYLCKVYLGKYQVGDQRIPMYTFHCLNYDHEFGIFMMGADYKGDEFVEAWSELELPSDFEDLVKQKKVAWRWRED